MNLTTYSGGYFFSPADVFIPMDAMQYRIIADVSFFELRQQKNPAQVKKLFQAKFEKAFVYLLTEWEKK